MTVFIATDGTTVQPSTDIDELTRGLTYLGGGVSRKVYALDSHTVLKVGKGVDWAGTNLSEWEMWQHVQGTDDERYFARCFAYGRSFGKDWLIMERVEGSLADVVGWGYHPTGLSEVEDVADRYDVSDTHSGNVGRRTDGSLCLIDYAYNYLPKHTGQSESVWGERSPSRHQCNCGLLCCTAGNTACREDGNPCGFVWCDVCHDIDTADCYVTECSRHHPYDHTCTRCIVRDGECDHCGSDFRNHAMADIVVWRDLATELVLLCRECVPAGFVPYTGPNKLFRYGWAINGRSAVMPSNPAIDSLPTDWALRVRVLRIAMAGYVHPMGATMRLRGHMAMSAKRHDEAVLNRLLVPCQTCERGQ